MLALARLEAQRAALHEAAVVLCDPLWSSVLGFIVVHEARRANLVGPVADDILYSGIIAVNTARSGLAHEASSTLGTVLANTRESAGSLLKLLPVVGG